MTDQAKSRSKVQKSFLLFIFSMVGVCGIAHLLTNRRFFVLQYFKKYIDVIQNVQATIFKLHTRVIQVHAF